MKNLLLIATTFFCLFTFINCNQSQQNQISSPTIDSVDSTISNPSNDEDDLMMKIIKKEIKTPMDSALSKKCFDYMKTNYSLMNKILDNPISSNKEMAQVAMTNFLICVNSVELLEQSKVVLTVDMKKELETYKNNVELVRPTIVSLYQNSQK